MAETAVHVQVDGRRLRLTNLEKVLYPEAGFTKAQVIDYYTRIAPALLPHLRAGRSRSSATRTASTATFFYEKHCPAHRPDWVKTATVSSDPQGRAIDYCLLEDLPTLVWIGNLADLELHTSLPRAPTMRRARRCWPSTSTRARPPDIVDCCRVALLLRGCFDGLGLECFAKTSGSKGLQVYVPLNTRPRTTRPGRSPSAGASGSRSRTRSSSSRG